MIPYYNTIIPQFYTNNQVKYKKTMEKNKKYVNKKTTAETIVFSVLLLLLLLL